MKKVISFFLSFVLVFSLSFTAFATETDSINNETMFSYYNEAGELVSVAISCSTDTAISKVYVNGVLTQRAVADAS